MSAESEFPCHIISTRIYSKVFLDIFQAGKDDAGIHFTRICAINRLIYLRSGNRIIMVPLSVKENRTTSVGALRFHEKIYRLETWCSVPAPIFSKAIQKFTCSVWSHVGMIYRDPTLKRVFILESETLIGVRLAPLSKYLRDYHGKTGHIRATW